MSVETRRVREKEAEDRDSLREFVQRWAKAGPALEEQRYAELQELDDDTARRITLDLFKLWRPRTIDQMGGGLVEAQKVFIKLGSASASREVRNDQAARRSDGGLSGSTSRVFDPASSVGWRCSAGGSHG